MYMSEENKDTNWMMSRLEFLARLLNFHLEEVRKIKLEMEQIHQGGVYGNTEENR